MFTGIIQHLGTVTRINRTSSGLTLTIDLGEMSNTPVRAGDSISVNGVCLTVRNKSGAKVSFDVVRETLNRSNLGALKIKEQVNLEPAIRAGEPFGGHFVQGHTDDVGVISRKDKTGNSCLMEIATSSDLTGLMIEKGSMAVDGVSLTVVNVKKDRFSIALIPFTLTHTNLGKKSRGDKVNLEVDMIGKWVKKILSGQTKPMLTKDKLAELL